MRICSPASTSGGEIFSAAVRRSFFPVTASNQVHFFFFSPTKPRSSPSVDHRACRAQRQGHDTLAFTMHHCRRQRTGKDSRARVWAIKREGLFFFFTFPIIPCFFVFFVLFLFLFLSLFLFSIEAEILVLLTIRLVAFFLSPSHVFSLLKL